MPKKFWIQHAIKHKGRFTAYCRRQHMGKHGVSQACINKGEHARNATTRKEANLANTLRHFGSR